MRSQKMKLTALAPDALSLISLTLAQNSANTTGNYTWVNISLPTYTIPSIPKYLRSAQLDPATTTPPGIPYTVSDCGTANSAIQCNTWTYVCAYGSTTTLMSWLTSECNWRTNPTEFPAPPLSCSNTRFTTSVGCYATTVVWPDPVTSTRSHVLLGNVIPTYTADLAGRGKRDVAGEVQDKSVVDMGGCYNRQVKRGARTSSIRGRA